MKILFLIEQLSGGGAERVTSLLANELAQRKEITVYLCKYYETDNEYFLSDDVIQYANSIHYTTKYIEIWNNHRYTSKIIRHIQPDVVISLSMYKANIPLSLGHIHKAYKLILSERNDPSRLPTKRYLKILRDFAYRRADGIVFQTDGARDYFINLNSVVIPNPIHIPSKYNYSSNREKYIINCSRLNEQKNLPMLIEAFSQVADVISEYSLYIYGEGSERENLEKLILNKNLKGRVKLCGFDNNVIEKISKAALFVSSSDYEGISNAMLESLALGTPTICTDCPIGGARLMINNMKNGILVKVGDVNGLAEAIVYMLKNYDDATRMGQKAMELREKYSVSKIADMWLSFVNKIVADIGVK